MTYGEVIAKRLQEICKEKGITINRLATLSGIRQSTLENIVAGHTSNPSLKTLHRIATGLNMTVSQLLDFPMLNEQRIDNE